MEYFSLKFGVAPLFVRDQELFDSSYTYTAPAYVWVDVKKLVLSANDSPSAPTANVLPSLDRETEQPNLLPPWL